MADTAHNRESPLDRAGKLVREGRKKDAQELLTSWMTEDRQRKPAEYDRAGSLLFKLGRLDKAELCYRKVLDLEPQFLPAYNNLATLYIQLGDYERAVKLINDGLELVARLRQGGKTEAPQVEPAGFRTGPDESLDLLRQAIGSGRPAAGEGGGGDLADKRPARGKEDLSDVVRRAAEMKSGGDSTASQERLEGAGEKNERLIAGYEKEGNEEDDAGREPLELAEAYLRRGNGSRALEVCRKWLGSQGADPLGHECRGRALLLLNRPDEALGSFDVALDLDDNLDSARLGKSKALIELDRFPEARQVLAEMVDRGTEDGEAYIMLGRVAVKLSRNAEAREAFQRGLEMPLDLKPEYARFIGLMFELGIGDLAVSLAQDLIRSFPGHPIVTEEIQHHLPDLLS